MTNPPLFAAWIQETRLLQIEAYGADYSVYATQGDEKKVQTLVDYITWNTKAATHELVELDGEISWKPWQSDGPYVHRKEVIKETVDALHFMANILAAVECTDQELTETYRAKMQVNRERQLQAGGYRPSDEGVKCPSCRRSFDDVPRSAILPTVCEFCEPKAQPDVHSA